MTTMNCRQARRCMSPYLDSELDPTTTFAISEHLRLCESCWRRFEAERGVDQAMVARLGAEQMPDELWRDLVRRLRQPRWKSWRLYAQLAAAAVIALSVWSGWPWDVRLPRPDAAPQHWLVREFVAETANGKPFASADARTITAGMSIPLHPFADLALKVSGATVARHVMQLVRLETVRDADGAEVVEVRLNCCGEPVIVRAARRDRPGRLGEFVGRDAAQLAALAGAGRGERGISVAQCEVGDYVVVAVSRHPMDEILGSLRVQ